METRIELSSKLIKQLPKIPKEIRESLVAWVRTVEQIGLETTRLISGYHDEPLMKPREGQRSIRLNRAWRAFYKVVEREIRIITVEEVSKHKY